MYWMLLLTWWLFLAGGIQAALRLPKPSPLRKVGNPTFNHSSPALFAQFYDAPSPSQHQKRGILPSI
jgi:hypothetical protein